MSSNDSEQGLRHRNVPENQPPIIEIDKPQEFVNPQHFHDLHPLDGTIVRNSRLMRKILLYLVVLVVLAYIAFIIRLWATSPPDLFTSQTHDSIEYQYNDTELKPYASMNQFRNSALQCRKTFADERLKMSFIIISNSTHTVWSNITAIPHVHEKILQRSADLTDFVCSSMVSFKGIVPPCICTIVTGDETEYVTFLDPHVTSVSKELADITEIIPIIGSNTPITNKIPWRVEIEYYPISRGIILPMTKVNLEGPEVSIFLRAISFMNERTS